MARCLKAKPPTKNVVGFPEMIKGLRLILISIPQTQTDIKKIMKKIKIKFMKDIMNKMEYGLLKNTSVQVHVHPDIFEACAADSHHLASESTLGVFVDIQTDTMQVPIGMFSMLQAAMEGTQKSFEAMTYLAYNAFSNWDFGLSHSKSIRDIGKLFSVSHQYVQQTVKRLEKKWMHRVSGKGKKGKFELMHHFCERENVPLDADGRPLKCAMPRGEGGIFERLAAGDIHWKAAFIWILLKVNSDWRTGETNPTSITVLQKWTRFGRADIIKFLNQLEAAGMLKKLEREPNAAQVYQLYPRPYKKKRERQPEQERPVKEMYRKGDWRYSFSRQYRINVKTDEIQYRKNRLTPFKRISDYHRFNEMPKAILKDFERARDLHQSLAAHLNAD